MLALAWVTSIAIALPIALGVNHSAERENKYSPCLLYNPDFIIYSSMGSFFIPSIIMLILYGKILLVLRQRAKKFAAKQRLKTVDNNTLQNVIENAAQTASLTAALPEMEKVRSGNDVNMTTLNLSPPVINDDPSITVVATTSDTPEDNDLNTAGPSNNAHVIPNVNVLGSNNIGYIAPTSVEVETQFTHCVGSSDPTETTFMPTTKKKFPGLSRNGSAKKERSRKTVTTKFKFNLRQSKRKKETKASAKREKKATKTLAIVLGVFLVCWVPFFTLNILSAICIRYNLFETYTAACSINEVWMATAVWLGYINSFLNPVIYTIFNLEFRKAFQKLLTDPCRKGCR